MSDHISKKLELYAQRINQMFGMSPDADLVRRAAAYIIELEKEANDKLGTEPSLIGVPEDSDVAPKTYPKKTKRGQ
jgi:hypothetical protein